MILRVKAELSEPPSSTPCFRDVTLYANIFCDLDVLVECVKGTRSIYWEWLKSWGAHDFVEQLIIPGEEKGGISVGPTKSTIVVEKLTAATLPRVVGRLMRVTEGRCGI
jgi:hypothetical protein